MAKIASQEIVETYTDEEGKSISKKTERTFRIDQSEEPDYVKVYSKMWCEFNNIPVAARNLFYELAVRMTYCNANYLEESQLVALSVVADPICKTLGIKRSQLMKLLAVLKEAGAIKQKKRGVYQINPQFAGKGEWKYNPKYKRGGIENLIATFDFKNKGVALDIKYSEEIKGKSHTYGNNTTKAKGTYTVTRVEDGLPF